jgi:hypothetical protein
MIRTAYLDTLGLALLALTACGGSGDSNGNKLFATADASAEATGGRGPKSGTGGTSSGGAPAASGGRAGNGTGGGISYPVDAGEDAADATVATEAAADAAMIADAANAADGSDAQDAAPTPMECTGDGDCSPPARFCAVSEGRCVACLSDAHCEGGRTCDLKSHTCTFACDDSGDCADPRPYCEPDRRVCVACLTDTNCGNSRSPLCHPERNVCVQCIENTDCSCLLPPAQAPCCTTANTCTCSVLVCL